MSSQSFEQTLLEHRLLLPEKDSTSVVFKLPEGCKFLIEATAKFLALCNQLAHRGRVVEIDFSDCTQTYQVWNRTGFFDRLDSQINVTPQRPEVSAADFYRGNNNALVEFGAVEPDGNNKGLINQLTDSFLEHSNKSYETVASTLFGEFISNVSEHSSTEILGFAALQKYNGKGPYRDHIQTVISDSGLGIVKTLTPSLESHHPDIYKWISEDDFEIKLVEEVIKRGGISRFGAGRGLGFKSTVEHAAKLDARLSVRQKYFSIEINYKNGLVAEVHVDRNLTPLNGTHICFDFYID